MMADDGTQRSVGETLYKTHKFIYLCAFNTSLDYNVRPIANIRRLVLNHC